MVKNAMTTSDSGTGLVFSCPAQESPDFNLLLGNFSSFVVSGSL